MYRRITYSFGVLQELLWWLYPPPLPFPQSVFQLLWWLYPHLYHFHTVYSNCYDGYIPHLYHFHTVYSNCYDGYIPHLYHFHTVYSNLSSVYQGSKYEPMWKTNIYSSYYLSGIQCHNMGHNGQGINLYGILIIPIGNWHAGGHSERRTRSPSTMCTSYILATR